MRKIIRFLTKFNKTLFFRFLGLFIRQHDNYIGIGSWAGEHFNDNSKYFALYLSRHNPTLHIYWFGQPDVQASVLEHLPNATFVKKDSFAGYLAVLRCRYFFYDQKISSDISELSIFKRKSVKVNLDHGIPLKKSERSAIGYHEPTRVDKIFRFFVGYPIRDTFICSSSPDNDVADLASFVCEERNLLKVGYPRNDYLISSNEGEKFRVKQFFTSLFSLKNNPKIILYAPTFRRSGKELHSLLDFPKGILLKLSSFLCDNNCVLVEKPHYADHYQFSSLITHNGPFIQIGPGAEIDFQELLLATDVLIGDYSGALLDFLLLDRPEIIFAYDYEYYRDIDSGLFYPLQDFSFGPVAKDAEELLHAISDVVLNERADYQSKREFGRRRFLAYEKGTASEQICNFFSF